MFVLLTLVLGCDARCPTFEELEVRIREDGESPSARERAEQAIANFRSWTTLDGVCVDSVRVGVNQTEWEHPAWLNDGRDQLRISPTTQEEHVYGATLHGLCHAADEALGGVSATRPDLFDHPIPGLVLTRGEWMGENFARTCARGPFADNGDDVDEACDPTLGYAQKRFMLETVFDAVAEVDTFPLLPFVLGEPVPLAMPEGAGRFNVKAAARGLLYTTAMEGRWVLWTFNPDTGALVQELVLEEFSDGGEAQVYWELLVTTGERVLLSRKDQSTADNAWSLWELQHDDTLAGLGASHDTAYAAGFAVAEPRGLWLNGEDSALLDPTTERVLGTASSLLGLRGAVFGAVGDNLLVRTEDGLTAIVRPDGVVRLTVPSTTDQGLITDRVAATRDGLLLHSTLIRAKEDVVLVGHDEAGGVHALATGCGEDLPVDSGIVMAFEVGDAPYLLVSGPEDMLVYPILPMP